MRTSVLITLSIVLICIALFIMAAFYAVLSRPNPQLKQTKVIIAAPEGRASPSGRGGNTFNVEVASTTIARARGLSGRDGLGADQGMLFLFNGYDTYGFWMKDMKFSIDMIWIKGNAVAGFSENAAPEPGASLWKLKIYYPPEAVDKVLEVNAGTVVKDGIKKGDTVVIQ